MRGRLALNPKVVTLGKGVTGGWQVIKPDDKDLRVVFRQIVLRFSIWVKEHRLSWAGGSGSGSEKVDAADCIPNMVDIYCLENG